MTVKEFWRFFLSLTFVFARKKLVYLPWFSISYILGKQEKLNNKIEDPGI